MFAVCASLVACSGQREIDFSAYVGADVAILVGDVPACVPRRHFTPSEAKAFSGLGNPDNTLRPVTAGRLELTAFLPDLAGYSNQDYEAYARSGYDRRGSPSTWVRIQLFDSAGARFREEVAGKERSDFSVDAGIGAHGFSVHRRDKTCVGQRAGAGGTIAIEVGPECLLEELRTRQVGQQETEVLCAMPRCFSGVEHVEGLHYAFDIHESQFANWSDVSDRVRNKVASWAVTGRGVASMKAYPTIDRACPASIARFSSAEAWGAHR